MTNAVIRLLTGRAPAAGRAADAAHSRWAPAAEAAAGCLVDDGGVVRLRLDAAGALRLRLCRPCGRRQQECSCQRACEFADPGLSSLIG